MSAPTHRHITISTGSILKIIAILLGLVVLWVIRDIALYLFTALLLAGVVYPFVRWAHEHHIPKGLAVIGFYIFLFGILTVAFALLVPALLTEAHQLAISSAGSTGWIARLLADVKQWSEQFGLSSNIQPNLDFQKYFQSALGGVVGTLTDFFGGVAGFVLVVVLSYYIIVEESALEGLFRQLVPPAYQSFITRLVWQVVEKLGGWLRGQLVLGLIIAVLYFIAFVLIGLPYALLLALFGGLLEFIPYVGPLISAIPVLFIAFGESSVVALVTLIAIIVIQQLENHVIVPQVMRKTIGLNPIISVAAFATGLSLFGIPGAIFSIPVATAASVVLMELLKFKRSRSE